MTHALPFCHASERGVISGILAHPAERLEQVQEQVPEGAFYHESNRAAFEVLVNLRMTGTPVDPVTFTSRAESLGLLASIGGPQAVNELYAHRPPQHHFLTYLRTLNEKRVQRRVIEVCDQFREMATTPGTDPVEMIDGFQKEALTISLERDERGPRHISEVLNVIDGQTQAALARLAENQQMAGHSLGLPRLDYLSQGLEPEDRMIIAGLSNTGKTALLVHMVRQFIKQELPGLIFMLDGSAESCIIRLYAAQAGVPQNHIKTGYGLSKGGEHKRQLLKEAREYLSSKGVYIDDRAALSIQQINATTRRFIKRHGIQWTAIDFFGNITCPGFALSDRVNMLTAVSKAWKQGVIDTKVPSILLAQVTAEHVKEGDIPPCSPHIIKDCKAAYEDATKVIALSRELRPFETLLEKELRIVDSDRHAAPPLNEGEQFIVASMAKSKDGALGNVWLRLQGDVMHWRDFNPKARISDSTMNAAARSLRKEAPPLGQGTLGPAPAPAPRPAFQPPGKSLHGPLKISRPERPPQKGEYMQAPKEEEDGS